MELRDLRALVAVLRNRSFTGAAEELGYTQSAVSQQIALLERAVGQRLVQRRPVEPTPAGARLAEHAARVLLRLEVATSELGRLATAPAALRIRVSPLAATAVLGVALRTLRRRLPTLEVVVESASPADALRALAAGGCDAALVAGLAGLDEPLQLTDAGLFTAIAVAEDPYVVALPTGHPLATRGALDLAALGDAPWVHLPEDANGPSELARLAGFAPTQHLSYRGADAATVSALVAAGLGLALVPDRAIFRTEGVVAVPVARPPIVHRSEVLTLRSPPPALAALVDALGAASTAPAR